MAKLVYVEPTINEFIEAQFPTASPEKKIEIYSYIELWWDHTNNFYYACNRAKSEFNK